MPLTVCFSVNNAAICSNENLISCSLLNITFTTLQAQTKYKRTNENDKQTRQTDLLVMLVYLFVIRAALAAFLSCPLLYSVCTLLYLLLGN